MRRDGRGYRTPSNGPGRGLWIGILIASLAGIAFGALTGYAVAGKSSPSATPAAVASSDANALEISTSASPNDTLGPTPLVATNSTSAVTAGAPSATPIATAAAGASTTFALGSINGTDAWAEGRGALQGCARLLPGSGIKVGLRLRVAEPDGATPAVQDSPLTLSSGATADDWCTELPPQAVSPGVYQALLYDQTWHKLATQDLTVAPPPTPSPTPMPTVAPTPPPPALPSVPPQPAQAPQRIPPQTAPQQPVQPAGQPAVIPPAPAPPAPAPALTQAPPPPTQAPTQNTCSQRGC